MLQYSKKLIYVLLIVSGLALALTGCEGPAEQAGENIDEAAENAADSAENAVENAGDAVENAGDTVQDATNQ